MKKFFLILLATILILLPSCTTIPDEPLSPVDSGNEEQNQPSDSDLSSDTRMTETQRKEIIDIIENLFGYNLSYVEGNLEADRFYESTLEATSFMHEGFDTIEKDPSAFEIFDETFFFPEANGEYVRITNIAFEKICDLGEEFQAELNAKKEKKKSKTNAGNEK